MLKMMIVSVVACATPYQAMGFRGGFESVQGGPEEHVIHVRVNRWAETGAASAYALRRASELCSSGYDMIDSMKNAAAVRHESAREVVMAIRCR